MEVCYHALAILSAVESTTANESVWRMGADDGNIQYNPQKFGEGDSDIYHQSDSIGMVFKRRLSTGPLGQHASVFIYLILLSRYHATLHI